MEKVKEQLKLSLENKSGMVQTGELTVVLDGLVVEQESLTNLSSSATSKLKELNQMVLFWFKISNRYIGLFLLNLFFYCSVEVQQNGEAVHESRDASARSTSRLEFIFVFCTIWSKLVIYQLKCLCWLLLFFLKVMDFWSLKLLHYHSFRNVTCMLVR